MSLTATAALLALIASLVPLALIGWRDPKRLRNRYRQQPVGVSPPPAPLAAGVRRVLWLGVAVPGGVLLGLGLWPALIIWLGALTAAGWALVHLLAGGPRRAAA